MQSRSTANQRPCSSTISSCRPAARPLQTLPGIKKVGDTFIGEMEHVKIKGKPMLLWGKGSPVYDGKGTLIAAIEVITVGEPEAVRIPAARRSTLAGSRVSPSRSPGKAWAVRLPGPSVHRPGVRRVCHRPAGLRHPEPGPRCREVAGRPVRHVHHGRALRHDGRYPPEIDQGPGEAQGLRGVEEGHHQHQP